MAKDGKDLWFAESARLHQNLLDHIAREDSTFEVRYLAGGLPLGTAIVTYDTTVV